ncbi:DUF418 domain-containing protein [Pelagicoccus albus]|uniref:DUF418 domain-containing protein n=1 Tax=Pelagicoccus albus TaxID=415222 RepID=A0A7X1E7J0_9BACT|nr:DUF418 domain-containing protein [Pelagicoccus albus]MBC2605193.1 DUF418 domain-containing protein [Pelagicoccus albus]
MNSTPPQAPNRLPILDGLRGYALLSIMLLHNIEHFDMYYFPSELPAWLATLNKTIWDSLFFFFGGKSYAIFALLFGVTFHIQFSNQRRKGAGFRVRFAWRMLLLLGFGLVNTAFYQGDILSFYALVGILIIPFANLSDRTVLAISLFLFLQPLALYGTVIGILHPNTQLQNPASWEYFGNMGSYIENGNLLETMKGNLLNGKLAVTLWSWENGRFFHMLALFLFGMLASRRQLFNWKQNGQRFWLASLTIACCGTVILLLINSKLATWIEAEPIKRPLSVAISSWGNLFFMATIVSTITLLYRTDFFRKLMKLLEPMGKMSLSNYIFQSILGTTLYYDFGLGLYDKTGATTSLLIGLSLGIMLALFSRWWMKRHRHGPLEGVWHKLTWL